MELRFLWKTRIRQGESEAPRLSVLLEGVPYEVSDEGLFSSREDDTGFVVSERYGAVTLPFDAGREALVVFVCSAPGGRKGECRVEYSVFAPLTHKVRGSYYHRRGVDFLPTCCGFEWKASNPLKAFFREIRLDWNILVRGTLLEKRAILPRLAYFALYPFLHGRHYWIVTDRAEHANDNGAAFFSFLMNEKSEGRLQCRPVFALSRRSPDWERMKKTGPVIPYMSLRHAMLHFFADHTVSAYSHDEISSPFTEYNYFYSNLNQHNRVVFLQHGITKDDLSEVLNFPRKNYSLFITAARREYDSIVNNPAYGYRPGAVVLTGFPRYDRLASGGKKIISVMPTWRSSFSAGNSLASDEGEIPEAIRNTPFFRFYHSLLTSCRLLDFAEARGYTVQFIPHPVLAPFASRFNVDGRVSVLCGDVDYSRVFSESALVLTDYSSVFFDMAYLRKPVVYAHFEAKPHYADGYFDYGRDGFGEVEHTLEGVVDRLIEYIGNDCELKDKYRERIDAFFSFSDRENSRRVYEAIRRLDEEIPRK